jgi:hypothetical protein
VLLVLAAAAIAGWDEQADAMVGAGTKNESTLQSSVAKSTMCGDIQLLIAFVAPVRKNMEDRQVSDGSSAGAYMGRSKPDDDRSL